jgi:hypothetical protein
MTGKPGIKWGEGKSLRPQIGPISADYEALCLYRARENEAAIPMIELLYETMHPALELTALRIGPTIETTLRRPVGLQKGAKIIHQDIHPKPAKPRRSWPPGMSKSVARSLGLV